MDAYEEVAPRLVRWGARLSIEGEDVAQESYVRVFGLRQPSAIHAPAAFLMRVARNLFVDRQRARARERALLEHSGELAERECETPDPERILSGKQQLDIALDALGRLPPRCREAFLLARFGGLGYAAVGRRMGISTSMVEKHVARAMAHLAKAMNEASEPGLAIGSRAKR